MYRITSQTPSGAKGGRWRVLPGDNHVPTRLDNPNLFLPTLSTARAKCRELNA